MSESQLLKGEEMMSETDEFVTLIVYFDLLV
jgi:hypothetical protein